MRKPCWHFLQAGHSLTSIRHPLHPVRRTAPRPPPDARLPPLQPRPPVADPEHLREVVNVVEVLELIARLAGEQPDVDQREHDAPEVRRGRDPPVPQHRRREQPELLEREIPAGPRELRPRQVAPRGQALLRVLKGRQHEQVAALVVAPILLTDPLERFLEGREVAHGRASTRLDRRDRTATGLVTRGSSSACSSTWSIVSTGTISRSCFTPSGTSTISLWFRPGTSTVFTPARAAAVSFSLSPPIGSTRPRSVSSPVIATSWRAGRRQSREASAAAMVIPADGPSFGTAPAGTWRCTSVCVNVSSGMPSAPARARSRLHAAWADSFITSPSWPVRVI